MRHFNTTGPNVLENEYSIPPLARVPLEQWCALVQDGKCFGMYAPWQSGKTNSLLAFCDYLNSGAAGEYRCVCPNLGCARSEDVKSTMHVILGSLAREARDTLDDDFLVENLAGFLDQYGPDDVLREALSQWAAADPRPLVLLLDKIDVLASNSLLSALSQLRAGLQTSPRQFPHSVVLCGMRDLELILSANYPDDAKAALSFVAEWFRLRDFTQEEVGQLLAQHTEEAGQVYESAAVQAVWDYTQGQVWWVNALAYEMCKTRKAAPEREGAITEADVLEAKERLIKERYTPVGRLPGPICDAPVWRVIEPMLTGTPDISAPTFAADLRWVQTLGLTAPDDPCRIINPIYKEMIPRSLVGEPGSRFGCYPFDCVDDDGSLNMHKLLGDYQEYLWRNRERRRESRWGSEVSALLGLLGYTASALAKHGQVSLEYGMYRRRSDLLLVWRPGEAETRVVVEFRALYNDLERTERDGLQETEHYMEVSAATEGHLVIFDPSERQTPKKKRFYHHQRKYEGKTIGVWGV